VKGRITIGVLAYQGDVEEHLEATRAAAKKLKKDITVVPVRTKQDIAGLSGLIIPGGESTTLYKLCRREGIFEDIKRIKNIFGTCAGAIMLSRNVRNKMKGQETLGLMDIEVERNSYGRQSESFEVDIKTRLGPLHAVFIRAPRITKVLPAQAGGKDVEVLAEHAGEIIACEQESKDKYYLALSFHPELTTTLFHEHFLRKVCGD
jgi:5'-phosphate synthase pdxT subunit